MVRYVSYLKVPDIDREMLQGIFDTHVHSRPCVYDRPYSEMELSKDGRDVGYRGMLFKSARALILK